MRYAIGIDLGGTHLRVALVNTQGTILQKESKVVGTLRDPISIFQRIIQRTQNIAGNHLSDLAGIGLGVPGICNLKKGLIHQLPHYPTWQDVPVRKMLDHMFAGPIFFDNDANMAALGEHWKGAAQTFSSFIMLTLGSGIGGGLFFDGRIWHGEEGFAGEVGHMTIETAGRPCVCGNKGCLEMYASAGAIPKNTTAERLCQSASEGKKEAIQFWKDFGIYLGIGIANLASLTGVTHFVIAGGIAGAFDHFISSTQETISKRTYPCLVERITILPSALKGDAALLGSAYSAMFPDSSF